VKPLAILVADDAPDIRELLTAWLAPDGHKIAPAANGRDAGDLLSKEHFDVLITDVMMPDGDALALIKNAKHLRPGLSILAISGGGRYLDAEDCAKMAQALGAHGTLLKPFSRSKLLEAIGQAIAAAKATNRPQH
jgi:DNA-binding NtrC family response regulator